MTLTTVPRTSIHGHYAIAQARAIIHDGGIADLVDIQFDLGFWRRAHIAPEWLRLGPDLSGSWHLTLYFRTGADGRLKEMPYIIALRDVWEDDPSFSWEAMGKLTQIDPDACWVTFRIRPDAPTVKPFLLRATVPPRLLKSVVSEGQCRMSGTLKDKRLLIESLVPVEVQE